MKHEDVMVVAMTDLAPLLRDRGFDLITDDLDAFLDVINEKHFFVARAEAEVSPQYRQIIPYVLVRQGERWYLLQRTSKQTEARLHHKMSLGIGGHVNPDTPELLDGLQKELEEEVEIEGDYDLAFAGILTDTSTEVGRVHLGAVFVLDVPEGTVRVRETEKMTGSWASREELAAQRESMETWSQIVYDHLVAR